MRAMKWIKRGALAMCALIAVTVLSGAAFEQIGRYRAARRFAMPGRLVDIGGRRIQLDCRGSGSPTVVLESGLDTFGSLAWSAVHDSIAATTRTCAYSRAGIMWSDPARRAFDSRENARDLRAALLTTGESMKIVLVGHSLGGPYAMTYAHLFDADVAGMVLVDASHPNQFPRMNAAAGKSVMPSPAQANLGASLAWSGLVRALPMPPAPATWPVATVEAGAAFLPTSVAALASETEAIPATLAHAAELHSLGDRPLVVLTAGRPKAADEIKALGITAAQGRRLDEVHLDLQREEATWSRRSRQEIVSDASHYIQFDRPDVVIRAVREVIAASR